MSSDESVGARRASPLHILYTQNIRGDLDLLPRLYTFLRKLQAGDTQVMVLDLGNACASEVWHCAVTGGRSALIVLDAMGYHAANVSGFLTPDSHTKLADNLMQLALVDADHAWERDGVWVRCDVGVASRGGCETCFDQTHPYNIQIVLTPHTTTELNGTTLRLAAVNVGQVGTVQVQMAESGVTLTSHTIRTLPPNTPPDPTIAGAVEFVLSEARYYQGRKT